MIGNFLRPHIPLQLNKHPGHSEHRHHGHGRNQRTQSVAPTRHFRNKNHQSRRNQVFQVNGHLPIRIKNSEHRIKNNNPTRFKQHLNYDTTRFIFTFTLYFYCVLGHFLHPLKINHLKTGEISITEGDRPFANFQTSIKTRTITHPTLWDVHNLTIYVG